MTTAKRKTEPKNCASCGKEFFPWRTTQKLCSKSCAAREPRPSRRVDKAGPGRDRFGRPGIELRCRICGTPFISPPNEAPRRKTCSRACAAQLKRRITAGSRLGVANPNFKSGKRVGVRDRPGEAWWYPALGDHCMAPHCDGQNTRLALHHISYAQHVRKAGGDVWDPRNAFTICNRCHALQHRRSVVLPVSCLPDAALDFALDLFGTYAVDYLRRYYHDDGDPRLEAMTHVEDERRAA